MHDVFYIGGLKFFFKNVLHLFWCQYTWISWLIWIVGEMFWIGAFLLEKSTCVSIHIACVTHEIIFWNTSVWPCIDRSTAHTCSDIMLCMIWICCIFFLFVLMTEKAKCSSSELLVGDLQPFLKFLININVVGHVTYLNSKASITSQ